MGTFLGFLLIYLLVKVVLIAVGIAIGFLLHWLVPSIDLGMGALIGVVATGFSIYFYGRLLTLPDSDLVTGAAETPSPITYIIDPIPMPRQRGSRRKA